MDPNKAQAQVETYQAHQSGAHAPDCSFITMNGKPVYGCGGTYVCPRCDGVFGWCTGAWDDTPALCDDCANAVQMYTDASQKHDAQGKPHDP